MPRTVSRRALLGSAALAAQAQRSAAQPLSLPHKVRLALIGVEGHTNEVLGQLKNLPDMELVAVSDPDPALLRRAARMPQAAKARQYTDYRELLDKEKLEMAAVCGPNGTRAEIIGACAERRVHVVAEKPLAIERADLERVRAAVAKNNIRLSMLLPMRFSPSYVAMKEIVDSGVIGEVAQMGGQKSYKVNERPQWMRRRASFGGTIPYIGVHIVDLMRFTSGRDMVEAAAFQHRIGYADLADMENTTSTIFRLDNNGTAALRMDYLRPETAPTHGDDRLRLAGTSGIVEYEHGRITLVTGKEKPHEVTGRPPARSLFLDFLASVYHGKPVGLELKDIYRVNEIVLAARESAEKHQIVKV